MFAKCLIDTRGVGDASELSQGVSTAPQGKMSSVRVEMANTNSKGGRQGEAGVGRLGSVCWSLTLTGVTAAKLTLPCAGSPEVFSCQDHIRHVILCTQGLS